MSTSGKTSLTEVWHFLCPECGASDEELGQLAHDDQIYCEICLTDGDRVIRLRRWVRQAEPQE